MEISLGGRIVANTSDSPIVMEPVLGGSWTSTSLPVDGEAFVEAISDNGRFVVGVDFENAGGSYGRGRAVLWAWSGGGWFLTILESPLPGQFHDVNDDGLAVGMVGSRPVAWTTGGAMTVLDPATPGANGRASAVNRYGDVAGTSYAADGSERVVVWHRTTTGWSAPEVLPRPRGGSPSTTNDVVDINDSGYVLMNNTAGVHVWDPASRGWIAVATSSGHGREIDESKRVVGTSGGAAVMWTLP